MDIDLVRRVEATQARSATMLATATALVAPTSGATACDVDGGALVALGAGRYVNRAVGIGLGGTPPEGLLDEVEDFFGAHRLDPSIEVSPWAPAGLTEELARRGYAVQQFRNLFARSLDTLPARDESAPAIEVVTEEEIGAWQAILGESTPPGGLPRAISDEFCLAAHAIPGQTDLLARSGRVPVACGSWTILGDGIGSIGAAATLVAHRGRGAQRALVVERLHRMAATGLALAIATALPDGQSARNLRGLGFELLYTQVVLRRTLTPR